MLNFEISGIDSIHRSGIIDPRPQPSMLADLMRSNESKEYRSYLKDNSITFYISKLLHTQFKIFDKSYYILPRKKGSFEIKYRVISEELEHPEEFTIPAIVKKI